MSKTFIQGGARVPRGTKDTKGALKALLKDSPELVTLFSTSSMGPQFDGPANELPDETEFCVVGPNPFARRDWYATVKKGRNGQIVCI